MKQRNNGKSGMKLTKEDIKNIKKMDKESKNSQVEENGEVLRNATRNKENLCSCPDKGEEK